MKRDQNLQPLSKQHHDELLSCLLIKKGVRKLADLAVLTDFTNIFWKDDLKKHIQIEQDILIPFLIRHRFEPRYINILTTDHSILQSILDRLNVYDRRHRVFEIFANLVEQHIRFKERFIFERVQELVSEKELEQLGLQLKHTSTGKCTDYPVRFWE
jgi:hemerythrin-like domain-containing protein